MKQTGQKLKEKFCSTQWWGLFCVIRKIVTIHLPEKWDFLRSPYLLISFLVLCLSWPTWTCTGWTSKVFAIIPSLLSFSAAGYAIWFTFGTTSFGEQLSEIGKKGEASYRKLDSFFMEMNAAFVFFIGTQLLSLLLALIADPWLPEKGPLTGFILVVSAFSYWFFLYAVCLIFAIALKIFQSAISLEIYHDNQRKIKKTENNEEEPKDDTIQ
ncbi:MAG: hypothetical protein HQL72_12170 [Magnetococcales bacterium]|nr:hypothetical protein [Magnetococcales bacterium]